MSNWKRISLLLLLLVGGFAFGQRDSLDTNAGQEDSDVQTIIEDAIIGVDAEEDTDWTVVTDFLEDLKRKPLNLNRASRDELLMVPGFTDIMVDNLLLHISRYGLLTSMYELQMVPGMTREAFETMQPYVTVKEISSKDIGMGELHPAGPSVGQMLDGLKSELMVRGVSVLEEQEGYTEPTLNSSGVPSTRYEGSPLRFYTRFRMRFNRNLSVGFVGEKDPGEAFKWDPDRNYYGFDYLSAHFFLKDFGKLKRLAVGDYTLQFGQGLILSSGLGFGKGGETINAVKRPALGIRPYASVNENQFFRGAASTVAFKKIYVTGFVSRVGRDANIASTADTLTNEVESVSTLQTSGFHRTPSEIEDKDAIQETMTGVRVEYKSNTLRIGTTHIYQQFSSSLLPDTTRDYQYYRLRGNENFINGVDFDWTVRNFNFFGEVGRSKSGGTGIVAGMLASLSNELEMAMLFRRLEPDFHSNRAYLFAERPTAASNETGLYTGLKYRPNPKFTFSAYFDIFRFPWSSYQISFPSNGHEYMVQAEYKPKRSTLIYTRFRSDNKQRNASEFPEGQQLEYLIPARKDNFRIHFDHKISRTLRIKSRFERSWYKRGDEEDHKGIMLYQDVICKIGYKWKLTGRYAIFDVEDSNARIYAYENDILGYFSIPGYNGRASRYYAMVNFKPVKGLEFWLRYARTHYHQETSVGSGLNESEGPNRSEIKLQMRYIF